MLNIDQNNGSIKENLSSNNEQHADGGKNASNDVASGTLKGYKVKKDKGRPSSFPPYHKHTLEADPLKKGLTTVNNSLIKATTISAPGLDQSKTEAIGELRDQLQSVLPVDYESVFQKEIDDSLPSPVLLISHSEDEGKTAAFNDKTVKLLKESEINQEQIDKAIDQNKHMIYDSRIVKILKDNENSLGSIFEFNPPVTKTLSSMYEFEQMPSVLCSPKYLWSENGWFYGYGKWGEDYKFIISCNEDCQKLYKKDRYNQVLNQALTLVGLLASCDDKEVQETALSIFTLPKKEGESVISASELVNRVEGNPLLIALPKTWDKKKSSSSDKKDTGEEVPKNQTGE